jgi:S-formylglutathione hydrolase
METYVVDELPTLVESHFPTSERRGISGHSMGGHGALTLALRHPGRYASISAFAPIVAPSQVPWGQRAFSAYLGANRATWAAHDAVELVARAPALTAGGTAIPIPILVDQGEADEFLDEQLQPGRLEAACAAAGRPLTLRRHAGYDHGYYFVASFIEDHLAHHASALGR